VTLQGDLEGTPEIEMQIREYVAEGRTLGDVTTLRDPAVVAELEQKVAAAKDAEQ
jgi:hypothetical protein